MIKLDNVSAFYGKDCVLDNLSLNINAGKVLCVRYSSGHGATTLAKVASGLKTPTSGSVLLNNKAPVLSDNAVSLVLKQPVFLNRKNALKNLAYVDKIRGSTSNKESITQLLACYNITPTKIPKKMSAKEKFLLALARVEYAAKPIVIIDDILAPLSQGERADVYPYLLRAIRGKTVLILDSTGFSFKNIPQSVLVYGKVYPVPSKALEAQVFSARRLAYPAEEYLVAKVEGSVVKTAKRSYKLTPNQQKQVTERMVESCYIFITDDKISAMYDAQDEQKVF